MEKQKLIPVSNALHTKLKESKGKLTFEEYIQTNLSPKKVQLFEQMSKKFNELFYLYDIDRTDDFEQDYLALLKCLKFSDQKQVKVQTIKQIEKTKKEEPEPLEIKYYLELPVSKPKYLAWLETLTFEEIKKTLTLPPASEVPDAKDLRIINDEENIIARDKYILDWPSEDKILLLNIYNKINDAAEDSLHLVKTTNEEKELLLKLPSECLTFKLDYWKDINKK